MKCLEVFTDGGCKGKQNNRKAALAFVILDKDIELIRYSRLLKGDNVTNNIAELMAAISALRWLDENEYLDNKVIYLNSDSQYLVTGMNEWLDTWIAKGWKTNNKKDFPNMQLWKILNTYNRLYKIYWQWCRGHKKDINYNVVADELCNKVLK